MLAKSKGNTPVVAFSKSRVSTAEFIGFESFRSINWAPNEVKQTVDRTLRRYRAVKQTEK